MSLLRFRVLALIWTLAIPLLLAPSSNAAGYTTYWSSLTQSNCGYADAGGVSPGATKSRGNYGYNRRYSYVYANGGSWTWGAYYTSGSNHSATASGVGQWWSVLEINYWATQQTNPFIRNNNAVTVGAAGCFYWQ